MSNNKTLQEMKIEIAAAMKNIKFIDGYGIMEDRPNFNKLEESMECFVCKKDVTNEEIKEKKAVFIKHDGKEVAVHLRHHGIKEMINK